MSVTYKFSKRAQRDLVRILRWGISEFGEILARDYVLAIRTLCEVLTSTPNPGTEYRGPNKKHRTIYWVPVGRNVVFYRLSKGKPAFVVRVLDKTQLPELHLWR
jgi:plasmid stabilization system protein ParE